MDDLAAFESGLRSLCWNISIAGALAKAYKLGDLAGWDDCARNCYCASSDSYGIDSLPAPWSPNTSGEAIAGSHAR